MRLTVVPKEGDVIYFKTLASYNCNITIGRCYKITGTDSDGEVWFIDDRGKKNFGANWPDDYEMYIVDSPIAKPILEERKIGKVKMQLFDEGFPNAVMEIAKVMSWAEQNKGYKPNDFKNLPNADVEFSAAASRHKLKGLIQKDAGLPPLERVDEESGIVHLAHQAFNILAELELVLTGRIKE